MTNTVSKIKKDESDIHPVDFYVGKQLRSRRMLMGMSQSVLGKAVGLTFQQIQKYERAVNRVSVSRLYDFCKVLNVDFDYFIEGFKENKTSRQKGMAEAGGQAGFEAEEDVMVKRETLELVRAYYNIKDEKLRRQLLKMARTMSEIE